MSCGHRELKASVLLIPGGLPASFALLLVDKRLLREHRAHPAQTGWGGQVGCPSGSRSPSCWRTAHCPYCSGAGAVFPLTLPGTISSGRERDAPFLLLSETGFLQAREQVYSPRVPEQDQSGPRQDICTTPDTPHRTG